jgi:hypothetical protein
LLIVSEKRDVHSLTTFSCSFCRQRAKVIYLEIKGIEFIDFEGLYMFLSISGKGTKPVSIPGGTSSNFSSNSAVLHISIFSNILAYDMDRCSSTAHTLQGNKKNAIKHNTGKNGRT